MYLYLENADVVFAEEREYTNSKGGKSWVRNVTFSVAGTPLTLPASEDAVKRAVALLRKVGNWQVGVVASVFNGRTTLTVKSIDPIK